MHDRTDTGRRGEPSRDDGGTARGEGLAEELSELARTLEKQPNLQATLDAIVHAAVATVPGAMEASISEVQRRQEVKTLAATGELPRSVDHAQYDLGEGPCLDTLYQEVTIRLSDLAAEERWPRFVARARELGVASMLGVQLFVDGEDLGALNLMSRRPGAFDDESEHVALLFASHAAVALSGERVRGNLKVAMSTREVIGQAQGILMERFKVTGELAFHMLIVVSQKSNRKLREVAEDLVATGHLPEV